MKTSSPAFWFCISSLSLAASVAQASEINAHTRWLEDKLNGLLPTEVLEDTSGGAPQSNTPDAKPKKQIAPWTSQPLCNNKWGDLPQCSFNHKNGHGLFVLKQPQVVNDPNFLVCVNMAGQQQSWIDHRELISARCQVSSMDWEYGSGRSDYRGVLNWLTDNARDEAITMPALLATQCNQVFPEAAICSPSLLVLPTSSANEFDVCALHTLRQGINLIILEVHQGNSKWKCERKDLNKPDRQERLSVAEWSCVPNAWGYVDKLCPLPYIPTTEPLRVNRQEKPTTPYPVE
jgi:hypothetical protein